MRMGVAGAELVCLGTRSESLRAPNSDSTNPVAECGRVRKLFLLPFLFALAACAPITSPDQPAVSPAKIRFVLDGESCRGAISLDFLIDEQVAGVKFLAAGDSAEF